MKLETLTAEDFAERLNDRFTLVREGEPPLEFELVELSSDAAPRPGDRAPFSLVFRGPSEPVLAQRIYALENGKLGRLEILLVPVGLTAEGARYEAVFG